MNSKVTTSITRTFFTSVIVLVASASVSACGASIDEEVDSPEAALEGAESAKDPHRGPVAIIVETALEELDLTSDQRAQLQGLFGKPREDADAREAHAARAKALADAVREGAVDASAFPRPEGKRDRRAAFAKDLDALHALLTPAQRVQLVAALRDRMPAAPPDGKARGERHGPHGHGGPLGFLLHDLGLTDAQQASIERALGEAGLGGKDRPRPDFDAMKQKVEASLEAFEKESFSAADVLPAPPPGAGPHELVEALAVVVPLLDDSQRERLADKIVQGPLRHGPRGRRGALE